jgi:hypothetical protein
LAKSPPAPAFSHPGSKKTSHKRQGDLILILNHILQAVNWQVANASYATTTRKEWCWAENGIQQTPFRFILFGILQQMLNVRALVSAPSASRG